MAVWIFCTLIIKITMNYIGKLNFFISKGWDKCIIFDIACYLFWYEVGAYYLKLFICKITSFVNTKIIIYALIATYMCVILCVRDMKLPVLVKVLIAMIGVILAILLSSKEKCQIAERIGRVTMPIYLLHGYVISAFRLLLTKSKIPDFEGVIPLVFCTIAGIALPWAFYAVASKFPLIEFCFYPGKYLNKSKKKEK